MENPLTPARGWRVPSRGPSLPEVHGSIVIPEGAGFWRKMFAFAGPGYLVAVGYMDPGNWATDLAGGARYGYTLLSVIMLSNLMAILLQALAARLGIASGRDLAQACRDSFSRPTTIFLWIVCEIAIAACDLAEVIGAAIALNLLFGLPLSWGVSLTALDVLVDRADPKVPRHTREQARSDPVCLDRLLVRVDVGAVHQRRNSRDGRGVVSRQRP